MRLLARPHQILPRLAAGALILNSGLTKGSVDKETAAQLHGMAAGAYPFLRNMDPKEFVRLLSKAEIALGVALAIPLVPSAVAGAALTAFAGGLFGLYLKTPGMREKGSVRPTHQGMALAKDVWLLGIGAGLVAEALRRD
ncbi:hypothetical protein [Planobispora longispora]|uniref:DoxX family membrane protein n=1 Tax=Planobispora longispora TaxID=28887 RepID=A0A8J3RJ61_9ACTN|nr:hypothetical protein [Planobispora longispora]BFE86095.1 hypothetical protein GCM10020093_086960 [Planobispora longispora]GIH75938.1 hypothetical protein Plo01_23670 [Planobispora longispora]